MSYSGQNKRVFKRNIHIKKYTPEQTQIYNETLEWKKINPCKYVSIISYEYNLSRILLKVQSNISHQFYQIYLNYPANYPNKLIGYSLENKAIEKQKTFKFTKDMSNKLIDKNCTLGKVLMFISKTINNLFNQIDISDAFEDISEDQTSQSNDILVIGTTIIENNNWDDSINLELTELVHSTEPVPEHSTEPTKVEHSTEPVPEQSTEPIPEHPTEPVPEHSTEPVPEHSTEPVPEQSTEPVPEHSTEPVPEHSTEPVPEHPTEPTKVEHPTEPTKVEQSAEPTKVEHSTEPVPEHSTELIDNLDSSEKSSDYADFEQFEQFSDVESDNSIDDDFEIPTIYPVNAVNSEIDVNKKNNIDDVEEDDILLYDSISESDSESHDEGSELEPETSDDSIPELNVVDNDVSMSELGPTNENTENITTDTGYATPVGSVDVEPKHQPEITYADVYDKYGIYVNLDKYVGSKNRIFSDDEMVLVRKQSMKFIKKNKSDIYEHTINTDIFSPEQKIEIAIKEYVRLHAIKKDFDLECIDNNIFNLRFKLSANFFDLDSRMYRSLRRLGKNMIIEFLFDPINYLFIPPDVRLVSPIIESGSISITRDLDIMKKENWHVSIKSDTILNKIKEKISDRKISTERSEYTALDFILHSIERQLKNFDDNYQSNKQKITNTKNGFKKGTGYSSQGSAGWNASLTIAKKEYQDNKKCELVKSLTSILTKMIMNNQIESSLDALTNSIYITHVKSVFKGSTTFDLLKNQKLFDTYLDSMRVMPKEFISLFVDDNDKGNDSLLEIFNSLTSDFELNIKTLEKSDPADPLINSMKNFISFVNRLNKITQTHQTDYSKKDFEDIYKTQLSIEQFKEEPDMNLDSFDYFRKISGEDIDTVFESRSLRHVSKEIVSIKNSLPLDMQTSIFFRYNSSNLKYFEFMIVGPESTPYDAGCFMFRMYCRQDYPQTNPLVRFYTTGGDTYRFNPNLYANGKVCLSLLGTWQGAEGENWIPGISSMLQVMISIQSLIFVEHPYFNEPGYQSSYNTPDGMYCSEKYNNSIRLNTMKLAMVDAIRNPERSFRDAIHRHFILRKDHIIATCKKWVDEAMSDFAGAMQKQYDELVKELNNLTNKNIVEKIEL